MEVRGAGGVDAAASGGARGGRRRSCGAGGAQGGRRRCCGEWRRAGAAQAAPATGRTRMEEFGGRRRRRFVAAAANG